MIGQYLSNTNEIAIVHILQKILPSKQGLNNVAILFFKKKIELSFIWIKLCWLGLNLWNLISMK